MKRLFLIDAYALVFKYYYAFMGRPMRNRFGMNTSILFGFTKFLRDIMKRESPDMLGVALEALQYNLIIKSHLKTTRFDTADAIVCLGTEEDVFLRLAQENFVPLLTVDARVHDDLFFQVSQNFEEVKRRADAAFGEGNYSPVFVDTYNEALKKEIFDVFGEAVFIDGNGLERVPRGNIVTVNRALTEIPLLSDRHFLLVPALTDRRVQAVIDCFRKAVSKEEFALHKILV